MKRIITPILLLLFAVISIKAQTPAMTANSKYPFSIYKIIHDPGAQNKMVSVFVKGDVESIAGEVQKLGGIYKYAAGDIAVISIPANKINALAENKFVQRIEGREGKLQVLNDTSTFNNNTYLVQQGFGLPQAYNGDSVVIGIIDEGIDFTHKDLQDGQGHTRIKWLWDQRLGLDTNLTPHPYNYGQNFTNSQIDNLEAGSVVDHDYSHGTHVTGIAAGNGFAVNNYKGVAPDADIIFVAVNTNASDDYFLTSLVDAVQYIFNKADSMKKPCSINISLGTYFGSHDALDLQAQAIDNLLAARNGQFISCAAGNEGSAPIHTHTIVTPDSEFTWFGGYTSTQSLYFQLWADSADLTNVEWMVGVDQSNPYNTRGGSNFQSATAKLGYDTLSIYSGPNRLGVVETYLDYSFGRYSIECLITPDSANYVWRFMTRGTGKFDSWSYDGVPAGLPDSITFPLIVKYVAPDTWQNICSSFTCSKKVMTAGSYVNRQCYTDMNNVRHCDTTNIPGALSDFSSHGPTRDGRIKPEIMATGTWVCSCAAQYDLESLYAYVPTAVCAGSLHRITSGTSMASPVVTGVGAMYLQKNPTASYQQVRDAITCSARTDKFTDPNLPDNIWGYGKIDAYKVIKGCTVGLNEVNNPNVFFENYPNPFSGQTTIHYDFSYLGKNSNNSVIVFNDALGRKVREISIKGMFGDITINGNEMGGGVYFYSLVIDGSVLRTNKMIVM